MCDWIGRRFFCLDNPKVVGTVFGMIARQNRPRTESPKQSKRLCPVTESMIYHVYGYKCH